MLRGTGERDSNHIKSGLGDGWGRGEAQRIQMAADEGSVGAVCGANSCVETGAAVLISDEVIVKANAQFWEQMVAMRLEPMPNASRICGAQGDVRSMVRLSGAWSGEVRVQMARGLAQEATAVMLSQAPELVTEVDMLDAAREIANMIAGVLKVSLPRPCTMSLPQAEIICGAEKGAGNAGVVSVAFQHQSGDLLVRVKENGDGAQGEVARGDSGVLP